MPIGYRHHWIARRTGKRMTVFLKRVSLSKIKEQRLRQDLSLNIYKSLLKYKCIEREDLRKLRRNIADVVIFNSKIKFDLRLASRETEKGEEEICPKSQILAMLNTSDVKK